MKVLKNNFNVRTSVDNNIKSFPKKIICRDCESVLEYEESDIYVGTYGISHINCPLCGSNNILDDEYNVTLTKDNVIFPQHFLYTSVETGAVDSCNNEYIKACIREAINYFRENKHNDYYYCGTGNTLVFVLKYDGDEEYEVIITDKYYNTYIPFESEDYGGRNNRYSTTYSLIEKSNNIEIL